MRLPVPDYDADDVLLVHEPEQLRALAEGVRTRIVALLRERACSTTQLAGEIGLARGTISHHLKVLEAAGLVRVVRTRKVRAVTERYYGRVARLFVLRSTEALPEGAGGNAVAAAGLRRAADDVATAPAPIDAYAFVHVRLLPADRRRFERRLDRLAADVLAAERPDGRPLTLVGALYARETLQ